jgi:flagellar basal body-associated protein FliL
MLNKNMKYISPDERKKKILIIYRVKRMISVSAMFLMMFVLSVSTVASASSIVTAFNPAIRFLQIIAIFLGTAVTFWGAVQLGMAYRTDDAHAKTKGMQILIAGLMVLALPVGIRSFIGI